MMYAGKQLCMDANDGVYVGVGAWVSVAWRGLYEVKCKVPGSNGTPKVK